MTSTDERARVESQPCGKWNKLHVMTLLTDVAQLLDGWHQDGTAWSEWDEEVRQRVSSYLRQVHTTPSEQFDTSVTALREENARLKVKSNALDRAHALLDRLDVPPAQGRVCDDPNCETHIEHRIHMLSDRAAALSPARESDHAGM